MTVSYVRANACSSAYAQNAETFFNFGCADEKNMHMRDKKGMRKSKFVKHCSKYDVDFC